MNKEKPSDRSAKILFIVQEAMILVCTCAFFAYSVMTKTHHYERFVIGLCAVILYMDGVYWTFSSYRFDMSMFHWKPKTVKIYTKGIGIFCILAAVFLTLLFVFVIR